MFIMTHQPESRTKKESALVGTIQIDGNGKIPLSELKPGMKVYFTEGADSDLPHEMITDTSPKAGETRKIMDIEHMPGMPGKTIVIFEGKYSTSASRLSNCGKLVDYSE